jgi:protein-S-isoprenylcysteine O-methyltransferase Ste14
MELLQVNAFLWVAWLGYWYIAARFVNRAKASEGWLQRLAHMLPMACGFYMIFQWGEHRLLPTRLYKSLPAEYVGMALTIGGLLFTVWARVHLGRYWSGIITVKEGHNLIRTGPYRFVRHPIYTGFVLATLGSALVSGRLNAFVGFALVVVAILFKVGREEAVLRQEFGDEYRTFESEVAALVPFVY